MTEKYEILPPSRGGVPARRDNNAAVAPPPRVNPGGMIESTLTRWEANRHARTIGAVAVRTRAEADLFEAQTQALNSYVKRQQAGYRLQELPEILGNDRARRRVERQEELRQVQHRYEVAEMHRQTEIARVDAVLVDAQQALRAQRDHGYATYELAFARKKCEMLDVELNAAERRAILRQHVAELDQANSAERVPGLGTGASDDMIDDALYEKRAQLNASGLDTSRIDAVIERRKSR
jgi:hypothetical protein